MRKLFLSLFFLLIPSLLFASWIYNPYTGKLDYYLGGLNSTDNITANYFIGNGSLLTGIAGGVNGTALNITNLSVNNTIFTSAGVDLNLAPGSGQVYSLNLTTSNVKSNVTSVGAVGTSLNFTGSNYADTRLSLPSSSQISISVWVNTAMNSGVGCVYSGRNATDAGFTLLVIPPTIYFGGDGGGIGLWKIVNTPAINDSAWHNIIAVWNGTGASTYNSSQSIVYIDGTNATDVTLQDAGTWNIPVSGGDLLLGEEALNSWQYTGLVDELVIYNKALNASEISSIYAGGSGLYTTNLANVTLGYHLDENTGSVAGDFSGNNHNATITSPAWIVGKVFTLGTNQTVTVLNSVSGINQGESGVFTFGNDSSRSVIDGNTVRFNINGAEKAKFDGNFSLNNSQITAPNTTATPVFTSYYGNNTKALGDPVGWINMSINGTNRKVPFF